MAKSEQRRQQKLAKQRAKKKQQAAKIRAGKVAATRSVTYAKCPIISAVINEPDPTNPTILRMASLSRETNDGRIAMSSFLIDMLCLGVKDAAFRVVTRQKHEEYLFGLAENLRNSNRGFTSWVDVGPEYLRKLVDSSIQYAQQFGLRPHCDWEKAYGLFGDVDADACSVEFTFGHDGKPLYIRGLHDSPEKSMHIVKQLETHAGPSEFKYLAKVAESDLSDFERKAMEA